MQQLTKKEMLNIHGGFGLMLIPSYLIFANIYKFLYKTFRK